MSFFEQDVGVEKAHTRSIFFFSCLFSMRILLLEREGE
jgi:hypothetical protein